MIVLIYQKITQQVFGGRILPFGSFMNNILKLVSSPIGNLKDLSLRGREYILDSDCLVCEDTRETKKLLDLLKIDYSDKVFIAFHEHNQNEVSKLVERVLSFTNPLLLSDAGSPILSDPGYPFIKEWLSRGGQLSGAPGVNSVVSALELSGLPPVPFKFHGFLSKKDVAKRNFFESSEGGVTHIFFESPYRVKNTIDCLFSILPKANVCIARELTKKFEELTRFDSNQWFSEIKVGLKSKGEHVILFHNKIDNLKKELNLGKLELLANDYLGRPSPKKLAKLISEITHSDISDTYNLLNKNKGS